jgi:hypothetical protein
MVGQDLNLSPIRQISDQKDFPLPNLLAVIIESLTGFPAQVARIDIFLQ